MKSFVRCLLMILLPGVARAEEGVHIGEIGLQGFYYPSSPTPVRIHIPALPQAQTIQLEFTIDWGISLRDNRPQRADHFRMPVWVTSDKPLEIEVPLLMGWGNVSSLRMVATDSRKQMIGQSTVAVGPSRPGLPLAIYCNDDRNCSEAQRQISPLPDSEEYHTASNQVEFVILKEPRQDWWAYMGARALVLASSVSKMDPGQRIAVEEFLRKGGKLILLEKEVSDSSFLAPYRRGAPGAAPIVVGMGHLYRVTSLESKELARLFPPYGSKRLVKILEESPSNPPAKQVLERVEVFFHFPRLAWLVTWIAAYVLSAGLVNFTILRRLRRLEWGWITVSLTSFVFAAGLYALNSSRRPKTFTLDSTGVYWMDGQSPIAVGDFAFRVSSPRREKVTLSINDDVMPKEWVSYERPNPDIATDMTGTGEPRIQEGLEVRLGVPYEMEFPMLQWAYKDFLFEEVRKFPGTVHWTSEMHLKNETGQKFKQAIYLDRRSNKQYMIGALGQGQEIDLAQMTPKTIWTKNTGISSMAPEEGNWMGNGVERAPFAIEEMSHANFLPAEVNRIFIGENDAPMTTAKLSASYTARQTIALTLVNLDQP